VKPSSTVSIGFFGHSMPERMEPAKPVERRLTTIDWQQILSSRHVWPTRSCPSSQKRDVEIVEDSTWLTLITSPI
jgi:hypothetical protein